MEEPERTQPTNIKTPSQVKYRGGTIMIITQQELEGVSAYQKLPKPEHHHTESSELFEATVNGNSKKSFFSVHPKFICFKCGLKECELKDASLGNVSISLSFSRDNGLVGLDPPIRPPVTLILGFPKRQCSKLHSKL